jgi:hypothetical protein
MARPTHMRIAMLGWSGTMLRIQVIPPQRQSSVMAAPFRTE